MASFTPAFHTASHKVHCEHQELINQLAELDAALDELVCYSEVFANLASAGQVCRCGRRLAELLPEHFGREESTVLTTVAQVSPELADFAREMRCQHDQLRLRLSNFCRAVEQLESGQDLDDCICRLKQDGKMLASELTSHVALEESQLQGFL